MQEFRIRRTFLSFRNLLMWLFMKYYIFIGKNAKKLGSKLYFLS